MSGRIAKAALQIADTPQAALTPAQRRFNQLVKRIEAARASLEALQREVPRFMAAYQQQTGPLLDEVLQCSLTMVVKIEALLAIRGKAKDGGWSAPQRRTLERVLCDLTASLIDDPRIDVAQLDRLTALHDHYADIDHASGKLQELDAMKLMIQRMTSIDIGDQDFESTEDLLRYARQKADELEQSTPFDGSEATPTSPEEHRQQRARRVKLKKQEAQAREASQSVREVYRKLASALHPDRATDDADRIERTVMMQRVNQAYDKQDLLALFSLQLEIEQVDATHLARATAEKAAHYNRVLSEQLSELQAEIDMTEAPLRLLFPQLHKLDPAKLDKLLREVVAELRGDLSQAHRELRLMSNRASAAVWVDDMRRGHDAAATMRGMGFSF